MIRRPANLGMLLLAVYLILVGLNGVLGIHFGLLSPLVPLTALIAGILLLLGR